MKKGFSEKDTIAETAVLTEEYKGSDEDTWPLNSASRRVYEFLEDNFEDWTIRDYYMLVRKFKNEEFADDMILEEYNKIHPKNKAYEQSLMNSGRE